MSDDSDELVGGELIGRFERVIGSDDRVQITNASSLPYSAVVKLYMDFGSGFRAEASGAMIGPNDVLTAGHALWDPVLGYARSVTVVPGMAGSAQPFGSATSTRLSVPNEYISSGGSFNYDIGVINLSSNIGNSTGWFNMQPLTAAQITGAFLNHSGYSGDRSSGLYQYYAGDLADSTSGNRVFYNGALDTFGGNSGGPLWELIGGTRTIVGVHTFGSTTVNGGTILTSDFHSRVVTWASDEAPTTVTPTGGISGTSGSDLMTGGSSNDVMRGMDGQDTLSGGGGNDIVYGNRGTDLLFGQDGNDTLYGGQNDGPAGSDGVFRVGRDTVFGGGGADAIYGNHGADVLFGEGGADTLYGGQNDDVMYGGDGGDRLFGNLGDDVLYGDNETSSSGAGNDTINGGEGTDTAVFLNGIASYRVFQQADGSISVNGADVLISVEFLRFSDTTVSIDYFV
ncbi:MAG: trypsin-like serine protease [Alphaproteobacteria bacterium]|nr:trypsin-like serine protease [Alphaproteobacteria bacterium]